MRRIGLPAQRPSTESTDDRTENANGAREELRDSTSMRPLGFRIRRARVETARCGPIQTRAGDSFPFTGGAFRIAGFCTRWFFSSSGVFKSGCRSVSGGSSALCPFVSTLACVPLSIATPALGSLEVLPQPQMSRTLMTAKKRSFMRFSVFERGIDGETSWEL
jgi:hypothetical protein